MVSPAASAESLEQLRNAREAYINGFRTRGSLDPLMAARIEKMATAFLASGDKKIRAGGLFELGTLQRIGNRWEESIRTFQQAAKVAEAAGDGETLFNAYLGIARSHAYGTKDHGAAAAAFEQAVDAAGANPSAKQRLDIAGYSSQLHAYRVELEEALIHALKAVRLAEEISAKDPGKKADLFYAQFDLGGILLNFAESCDYRKLQDDKSFEPGDDPWGACRRSAASAGKYFADAKQTAQALGWNNLAAMVAQSIGNLGIRLQLINQRAAYEKLGLNNIFEAKDVRDVLVNDDFSAGGSALDENRFLAAAIDEVVPRNEAVGARNEFLLGIKADLDKEPGKALEHFQRAAVLLRNERASFFDPRQQGTLMENRIELITNLGLRLLRMERTDEAFAAFESARANGLSELAFVNTDPVFSAPERNGLAQVVLQESREGALTSRLVELAIAGSEKERIDAILKDLEALEPHRRGARQQAAFKKAAERFTSKVPALPDIGALQSGLAKENHSCLIYWITATNVLAWVVTPASVTVKTVFLPEVALTEKVNRVISSARNPSAPFDEKAARQLHTYLIKPFAKQLGERVIIIPQGALVHLPFEALVDAETGRFLAEEKVVSYAPNVRFAIRSLARPIPRFAKVGAVYTEELDRLTKEVSRLKKIPSLQTFPHQAESKESAMEALGKYEACHVLLHGRYHDYDPLLSEIQLGNPKDETITAAELLSVDWSRTRLAVFSSCEGAKMRSRISNEVVGIPWALLAGGIDNVILSRWEVGKTSNADWMEAFYQALASPTAAAGGGTGSPGTGAKPASPRIQTSPALASTLAMRKMILAGNRNPFFWAGPQAFGR